MRAVVIRYPRTMESSLSIVRGDRQVTINSIAKHYLIFNLNFINFHNVIFLTSYPFNVSSLISDNFSSSLYYVNFEIRSDPHPYPDYEPMAFWGDNKKLMKILVKTDH